MKLVIQRVSQASVVIDGGTVGTIRTGLVVFIGISRSDTLADADYLSDKVLGLRIFPDESGKMNRNIAEAGGGIVAIPRLEFCTFTPALSPIPQRVGGFFGRVRPERGR